ncbi:glycosyltransferase family protein [Membranihabitans marinus]|uniref:hypothetical protein n=1 Tax=Membranihabitans marinus TaxID=1227546 RepID=UPI001F22B472|nr:hypothetical protein [Membranihabitans marinus]
MILAPIILFVYNRPDHSRQTIEALAKNHLAKDSILYIFSDGPKSMAQENKVNEVRQLINKVKNKDLFKEVIIVESPINKGLAQSIKDGVSQVFNQYDKVIVLEDDLITAVDFLSFINQCLIYYRDKTNIGSVTGYSPIPNLEKQFSKDVYIANRNSSLGWGTWRNRWSTVDWDCRQYQAFRLNLPQQWAFGNYGLDRVKRLHRQIQMNSTSWSIKFGFHQFNSGLMTIYPRISRLKHIGWDGSGTHSNTSEAQTYAHFNSAISSEPSPFHLELPEEDPIIRRSFQKIYGGNSIQQWKYRLSILWIQLLQYYK